MVSWTFGRAACLLIEVSSNGNDLMSSEEQEKEVWGAQVDEMWMVICSGSLKWGRVSREGNWRNSSKPAGSVLSRSYEPGKVRRMRMDGF